MQTLQNPLLSSVYRRACNACTAAKRRCTKQHPTCNRCATKSLECCYPPTRRNDAPILESTKNAQNTTTSNQSIEDDLLLDLDIAVLDDAIPPSVPPLNLTYPYDNFAVSSNPFWFLAWDSWTIAHLPLGQNPEPISEDSLHLYISTIQTWLHQWVTQNHCSLIHRELYRLHMPRCIQDAFTTTLAYINRTSSTQKTIFRMIDNHADELVQQYTTRAAEEDEELDIGEHLARVQALFVYQVIRLFDGDIRMRARAETHDAVLKSWNSQLWHRISTSITSFPLLESLAPLGLGLSLTPWKAWCFLESLRRTCLTTSILQSAYATIKNGIADCPGGIICTFGAGVWDAKSEVEWEGKVGRALFKQSLNIGEVVLEEIAESVDEFGHAILVVSIGEERRERWVAEGGHQFEV